MREIGRCFEIVQEKQLKSPDWGLIHNVDQN